MKKFLTLGAMLGMLLNTAIYPLYAQHNTSYFHTEGKKLIDPKGNPILLKGTNLGNWLVPEGYMFKLDQVNAPRLIDELLHEMVGPDSLEAFWDTYLENYITHDDIRYLKSIGCNHLRVPFHYRLFTDDLYMGKRNAGFKYLDRVVAWCREEGLYVLLDMHCAPGGQTGDNIDDSYGYPYLFSSKASQDLMSEIWVKIAQHYKEEPIIIGYDLMNEPVAHYFKGNIEWFNARLYELYKRLIEDIRSVDSSHSIFLNGSLWATNFDVFKEPMGENIVYEFHKYWFDVEQGAVQPYVDFSEKYQVPIYIGETGENTDKWVEDFRILLDENTISWCFWPYKKMNNTKGIMNFKEPEGWKKISNYARSNRSSYKEIRNNLPDRQLVQKALHEYLVNCRFEECFENTSYSKALGFHQ